MPHVSKRFLEKDKFLDIHKQLSKVITEISRSGNTKVILDELLTKTEKLMLAKRLSIILLIDQGESPYSIEHILKVSPSTVAKMSVAYENGSYGALLEEIKSRNNFWVQFQKIIPPRVGRNRFKHLRKQ